ncbi:hypothetical protein GCM10023219_12090 [Stakelama sediminis]
MKPGGSSDSGTSCPSAGHPAAASATATAPRPTLVLKIFKRHGLFNGGLRAFRVAPGKIDHAANDDDEKDEKKKQ